MGQYEQHVFICTHGETCPLQGETPTYVQWLRDGLGFIKKCNGV